MRFTTPLVSGLYLSWLLLAGPSGASANETDALLSALAEPTIASLEDRLQDGLSAIDNVAANATGSDPMQSDCIADKQSEAQMYMELATEEVLVLQASDDPTARGLAIEKLQTAVDLIEELVGQARGCLEDETDENDDPEVNNGAGGESGKDSKLRSASAEAGDSGMDQGDPTGSSSSAPAPASPLPPPIADGNPPTAASPAL